MIDVRVATTAELGFVQALAAAAPDILATVPSADRATLARLRDELHWPAEDLDPDPSAVAGPGLHRLRCNLFREGDAAPAGVSIRLGETVVGRPPVLKAAELAPLEAAPLLEDRRSTPRRSLGSGRQSRAANRLKLRSRLRDVYVLRPHPWALDVTRNVVPATRHGSGFLHH